MKMYLLLKIMMFHLGLVGIFVHFWVFEMVIFGKRTRLALPETNFLPLKIGLPKGNYL